MEPWTIGLILKPFGAALLIAIAFFIRYAIDKYMREGKFKTFLLKRRGGKRIAPFMRY